MLIKFSPKGIPDNGLTITVEGDVIMINGDEFDFGPLDEGDLLPSTAVEAPFFIGDITRRDGVIELTVVLPHGANAPLERRFPQPVAVTEAGYVDLPPYDELPMQADLPESPATEEVANGKD